SGRQLYRTHWFVQLFKDAAFNAAVKARWVDVRDEFEKVGATEVADLKTKIGVGAENDRKRWASEPKRYRSHGTYDQEIAFVTKWYKDRYNWMDGQLSN
ncbi:MAG: CotH kinase family protein, partial [Aeromicrobium sp.]